MTLKEFKVWGRKREEKDSLYIWAKDADDAIGIARLTDQSICISQWTGNEKSIESLPSAQPATNCSEFLHNSATISRQAAIEALQGRK